MRGHPAGELSAGRILTRIHSIDFGPTQFNPNFVSDESEDLGSRFDSTPDDPYSFLYAAEGDGTAVSAATARPAAGLAPHRVDAHIM